MGPARGGRCEAGTRRSGCPGPTIPGIGRLRSRERAAGRRTTGRLRAAVGGNGLPGASVAPGSRSMGRGRRPRPSLAVPRLARPRVRDLPPKLSYEPVRMERRQWLRPGGGRPVRAGRRRRSAEPTGASHRSGNRPDQTATAGDVVGLLGPCLRGILEVLTPGLVLWYIVSAAASWRARSARPSSPVGRGSRPRLLQRIVPCRLAATLQEGDRPRGDQRAPAVTSPSSATVHRGRRVDCAPTARRFALLREPGANWTRIQAFS